MQKVSKWENIVQNEKRTRIKKGNQGRSVVKRVGEKDTAFITQGEGDATWKAGLCRDHLFELSDFIIVAVRVSEPALVVLYSVKEEIKIRRGNRYSELK